MGQLIEDLEACVRTAKLAGPPWGKHTMMNITAEHAEAILALAQAADQAVETIDKVMELTDAYINVNISGKDYRFDATKELKDKLKALDRL